ncbi:hypothetical protein ACFFLZ_15235 [Photobacterium aphoticum]|uniref:Lipoprotein n=2 Tax=Photobacterium aphoticum TaxID=754436 RepID=A0A090QS88_9GAMM|nr:hypothetical protein [Photobacterium aphoticum]PSU57171.1 hypothetical protein C9I90_10250 [Photobacterium aphoticum]GAL04704.1 hypothetical protein JCM19237_4070 [Photobacterium aphoticum]GHA56448.1 hypothetical protein GCM10007086_33130 [Photobacterium aphoticum]
MKKTILVALCSLALTACSTMQPPRYASSVDNVMKLKEFDGAKAHVTALTQTADFSATCRLMGPIEPADGLTIPEFITKAINDEFKMASIYSQDGNTITGDIKNIEFSSSSGLTNGYWDISVILNSSNGSSLETSNKYTFKSGFDAITACNATADALTPAVQDLIKMAVNHPDFSTLIAN